MTFPPGAYIIGAQKSGTTSLAYLLDQHPTITLSNPKEPDFYTRNWSKGLDWYRGRFESLDGVLIDASTSYSLAPLDTAGGGNVNSPLVGVPERIRQVRPDARFIYILRDPAERIYSAYWHRVRQQEENRPFREAIARRPDYLWCSCYCQQLECYLEYFNLSDFHLVLFDELRKDPLSVARQCLSFLGVDYTTVTLEWPGIKNQSFRYNQFGELLRMIVGSEARTKQLANLVRQTTPKALHPWIKRSIRSDVPAISPEDRQYVHHQLADDIERLKDLTGIDFTGGT